MLIEGIYTKLRDETRSEIPWGMQESPVIDLEKLKADMAMAVERTSGRKFSLAATGGKNPDLYRNFVNNGQDKRMSAEVFVGIVGALGKNPADYVIGIEPEFQMPSAAALTSTFAVLLDSLGIDPYEDERARKLAAQFPNALRSIEALRAGERDGRDLPHGEDLPAGVEGRPSA
ncbi:hypothetical protein [Novosphingobium mathurense]|nr:hypothetical protein [Novosphingobium mathurense]